MAIQITNYGQAQLNANAGIVSLDLVKLGSAYNYVPSSGDTNIHGTEVFRTKPTASVAVNGNVVKYSAYVDYNTAAFQFGEIGLFQGSNLFALGTFSQLISKIAPGSTVGNSIRIDIYLSINGTNYEMWFDLAESNNSFRLASLQSPDMLPPSAQATPNTYVIQGADSLQGPILAFTDRNGLWSFDAYQYATVMQATVMTTDSMSVTIDLSSYSPDMRPSYFGETILEFVSGGIYSICRYIKTVVISGTSVTLSFNTALAKLPVAGDKFLIFKRTPLSSAKPTLPIATRENLGVVKIGRGLAIDLAGDLTVDFIALEAVTSVNGMVGDVVLNAANLPGLSVAGRTGDYNDLVNKPDPYVLPPGSATVRGGYRIPGGQNPNFKVTNTDTLDLNFAPIKTINGGLPDTDGNIDITTVIDGLINPTAIPQSANLNSYLASGLFYASASTTVINKPGASTGDSTLEVMRNGADTAILQRWSDATNSWHRVRSGTTWSAWVSGGGGGTGAGWDAIEIPNNSDLNGINIAGLYYSNPGGSPPPPELIYAYIDVSHITFSSDPSGHVTTYPNKPITMYVLVNGVPDDSNWTYAQVVDSPLTTTVTNNNRTSLVTAFTDTPDTATITFTATRANAPTQTKVFHATKDKNAGLIRGVLSRPSLVLYKDGANHIADYTNANTTITIFNNNVDDTANWTISQQISSSGLVVHASDNNKTATVINITDTTDSANIVFTASNDAHADVVLTCAVTKEVYVLPDFVGILMDEGNLPEVISTSFIYKDVPTTLEVGLTGTLNVVLKNTRDPIAGASIVPYVVSMPRIITGMSILNGWTSPFVDLAPGQTVTVSADITVVSGSSWNLVFASGTVPTHAISGSP